MTISNIIDQENKFLSFEIIKEKFPSLTYLMYYGIIKAFPER